MTSITSPRRGLTLRAFTFLCLLAATPTASAQVYTAAPGSPITGLTGTEAVVTGDFNNDGRPDLVYANKPASTLSVHLGAGNGTFASSAYSPVAAGIQPWQLTLGDFNADGNLDVAATNDAAANFVVYLGNGSGGFTAKPAVATQNRPRGITAGDFNRDGRMDIVVTLSGTSQFAVYTNDGTGTMSLATVSLVGTNPENVIARDFNKDLILDLAVVNTGANNVSILLGNGSGGFTPAAGSPYTTGNIPTSADSGDFNKDGNLDLAVGNLASSVNVFLGNGSGGFTAAAGSPFASGGQTKWTRVADMNNDGSLDIVAFNFGNVGLLSGNGAGGFSAVAATGISGSPFGGTIGDFNRDGRIDMASANPGSSNGAILLNTAGYIDWEPPFLEFFGVSGQNIVLTQSSFQIAFGLSSGFVTSSAAWLSRTVGCTASCVNVNTSGLTFFRDTQSLRSNSANVHSGELKVTLNLTVPSSTLTPAPGSPFASTSSDRFTTADFNRDGRGDVAVINGAGLNILLGQANGSLSPAPGTPQSITLSARDINAADVNNDGVLDLIVTYGSQVRVLLGKGDGSFIPLNAGGYAIVGSPFQSVLGDLNGDGFLDLVSSAVGVTASILLGNGTGSFVALSGASGLPAVTGNFLAIGDVNSDGKLDIVVVASNGQLGIFTGTGDGRFAGASQTIAGETLERVALRDLNKDGRLDVIFSTISHKIGTMIGAGNGTFAAPGLITYSAGADHNTKMPLLTGDFDGDGRVDVALAQVSGTGSLVVLTGNGNGTLNVPRSFATGSSAFYSASADFNADGRTDAVVGNYLTGELYVFLGTEASATTTALAPALGALVPLGAKLTLTATVTANTAAYAPNGTPTGNVDFFDGATKIGTAKLDASGVATLDVSTLTAGSHPTIKATYVGAAPFTASSSSNVNITISAPKWAITKTHVGNFTRGQTGATYTITVSNTGNAPAAAATVVDTVPAGLTLTGLAGTGWNCVVATATCTSTGAIANGANSTITATVSVLTTAATSVTNSATVSGSGVASATANDPTIIIAPNWSISKAHAGNFTQGQQGASYNITVTNNGNGAANAATYPTVTETLPAGLTLVNMFGAGWTCTNNACVRNVDFPTNAISPIGVTVNVSATAGASVTNQVAITGPGANTANASDPTTITAVNWTISKTHNGNFNQGQQNAVYTIVVTNTGNATANAGNTVTVTDTLPTGLTLVSMAGAGWNCVANVCTLTGSIAPAAASVITATVNVAVNAPAIVTNSVTVRSANGATATITDATTVVPTGAPSWTISKTHVGTFTQGQQNAPYTITVTNSGSATANAASLTEIIPAGLTLVSMAGTGWTCAANVCNLNTPLAANASSIVNVLVNVSATAAANVINSATVTGSGAADSTANDPTTVTAVNWSITKSHIGNFSQGQQGAAYTIVVTNTGTTAGNAAAVTETVPAGLTLATFSGTGWTCAANVCNLNTPLAAGASSTLTATVNVANNAAANVVNSVTVNSPNGASATANDATTITVPGTPIWSLTKTHVGNFIQGQQGATYTATVTNTGNATANAGTLTESLPPGMTLASMTGPSFTCAANICNLTTPLAANASTVVTIKVNVAANAASNLLNLVTMSGGGAAAPANAENPTTVMPPSLPAWTLTKTHVGNFTQGQSGAAYTVTVTNSGNAAANSGTLVDTLPQGLTLVSMAGPSFTCVANSCNLTTPLAPGISTAVTVTVNVAATAPAAVTNQVSMSGGGALLTASASDPTTINPAIGGVIGIPTPVSLTPVVSGGATGTYTFTFADTAGFQDLAVLNVLINRYLDGRNACYIAYTVADNVLYLVPDSGSGLLPGMVLNGAAGSTANSQCQINRVGSSAVGAGNNLTLTLSITFNSTNFGGNKVIYMAARSATDNSGWQTRGARGVPPLPIATPAPVGMNPASGTGGPQTLTFMYRDATSTANLQTMWALINTAIDGRQGCYVAYYKPGNLLFLYPDNGDGTQATSIVLTGNNTISNSQCTISAQGSSVSSAGVLFTLNLNYTFKPGFGGPKGVWLANSTLAGAISPWEVMGNWIVP